MSSIVLHFLLAPKIASFHCTLQVYNNLNRLFLTIVKNTQTKNSFETKKTQLEEAMWITFTMCSCTQSLSQKTQITVALFEIYLPKKPQIVKKTPPSETKKQRERSKNCVKKPAELLASITYTFQVQSTLNILTSLAKFANNAFKSEKWPTAHRMNERKHSSVRN